MAGKWCLLYDGINDVVNCGIFQGIYPKITFEFLANYNAYTSSRFTIEIGDIITYLQISPDAPYRKIVWRHIQLSVGSTQYDFLPPLDEWHHYAFTYDGAQVTILYDGNIGLVEPRTGTFNYNNTLNIGRGPGTTKAPISGMLAYVRIWNYDRDPADILAYKHRQINGAREGLIGNWRINEGVGDWIFDIAGGYDGYLGNGTPDYMPTWTWVTDCPIVKSIPPALGQNGLAGADMVRGLAL